MGNHLDRTSYKERRHQEVRPPSPFSSPHPTPFTPPPTPFTPSHPPSCPACLREPGRPRAAGGAPLLPLHPPNHSWLGGESFRIRVGDAHSWVDSLGLLVRVGCTVDPLELYVATKSYGGVLGAPPDH